MKRFFKMILCLCIMFVFGIKGAKAYVGEHVNLTKQEIDNVWSYHYRNGDIWSYGQLPFRYANDKLVYCIEPDVRIATNDYIVYDFNRSGYSEEKRKQMELISYYGYKYDNHNDIKYYIATQDLIWRLSPDEEIKWTKGGEYGEEIDVSKEKNEILSLINKHNVLPEFNDSITNIKVNEKKEFIDANDVLRNYDIEYSSEIEVIKDNNKLIVTPKKQGEYTIDFIHKKNYDSGTFLYDNFSTLTQSMAIFGAPNIINGSMKIISDKVDVNIYKKDLDTKELIKDKGIKIKIKDLNTNKYVTDILEFDDGKINISLKEGKYKIEEIKTVNPYLINDGLEFTITKDDVSKEIDFFNKKQEGKILINKINENNENLENVKFNIYDSNNNLVDEINTSNTKTASKVLPLGKYYIKEISPNYGYELDKNIYEIDLSYDDTIEYITKELDVINKKIKCEISVFSISGDIKLDSDFEVYDLNNNLVYKGTTINGEAKFNLEYGNYIIKEVSVPNGYKLNDNEINLEVSDDICSSKITFNNDKVIMPITSKENDFSYFILLFFNVIGYVFIKKTS